MKVFGQLESASLEALSTDPTAAVQGRFYLNTTTGNAMVDDGTVKRAILQNNGKAVFGTDSTASNNIRLHHAGQGLLQFVLGNDTTAENASSPNLAMLGVRVSNLAAAPATGNIGRLYYNTTTAGINVETAAGFLQFATLTGTETLTNKTLTAPTVDVINVTDQASAPAAPASGTKLYTRQGNVYKISTDGLEQAVGSGAASAAFNYLANGDAESGITTFPLATTALTSGLPSGAGPTVGSAASITTSAETTNPLRRTTSLKITAASAWTAGHGFGLGPVFTLQQNDLGKILNVTVNYRVVTGGAALGWTGTPGTQGLFIAVYDLTAGAWVNGGAIPGAFGFNQSAGTGQVTATFQASTTVGQQYQAFVFNGVTSTAACSVLFDEMSVSPNVANSADSRIINFQGYVGTTTALTANTTPIPLTTTKDSAGGWSVNQYTVPVAGDYAIGGFTIVSAGVSIACFVNGTVRSYVGQNFASGQARLPLSGMVTDLPAGAILTFRADANCNVIGGFPNDKINITRIGGQSGNTQEARVASSKFGLTADTAVAANAIIPFTTTLFDLTGSFVSGGQYRAPTSGIYDVYISGYNTNNSANINVYKNGVSDTLVTSFQTTATVTGSTSIALNAGDLIDVRPNVAATVSQQCRLTISRKTGPSAVAASESVNVTYALSANQSVAAASIIKLDTRIKDTQGQTYSSATGLATIAVTGQYRASVTAQVGTQSTLYLNVSGGGAAYLCTATAGGPITSGSTSIFLVAGQTVGIYSEAAATINGGVVTNRGYLTQFTLERTGN